MDDATAKKLNWFNPVTVVFLFAVAIDFLYCAYWASRSALASRGFFDFLVISLYPVSAPVQSVMLFFERLKDPFTGHVWGWEIFVSAFLAVTIVASLVTSVIATSERNRKMSVWAGVPAVLVWLVGALIAVPLSSIS
jgi:hypothetical protein